MREEHNFQGNKETRMQLKRAIIWHKKCAVWCGTDDSGTDDKLTLGGLVE